MPNEIHNMGGALMAIALLQMKSRQRERASKTPEERKADDDARAAKLAEQQRAQDEADRIEMERAPRAFRRRRMKELQKQGRL